MLEKLNLPEQEKRVYNALLKIGTTTTGPLCKEANIASSHIYHVLDKLILKGLVSFQEKNKRKIFFVSPPEIAQTIFDKRIEELEKQKEEIKKQKEEHINILKQIKPYIKPGIYFRYFENINGIKAMYEEILREMEKDKTHKFIGFSHKPSDVEKMLGYYEEFHKKRVKLKIPYKAIIDISFRNLTKKRKISQLGFLELKNDTAWGIYNNCFFIYHISSQKPYAILIKDKTIANTFKIVFDVLWKSTKK